MQTTTIRRASKPIVQHTKPFTQTEHLARENGRLYLQLAKSYAQRGDLQNAVSCCLEGLCMTLGVSRPLAIRDQLQDMLDAIDPTGETACRIKRSTISELNLLVATRQGCAPVGGPNPDTLEEQSEKHSGRIPIALVPQAIPHQDAHEPVVVLIQRGTGAPQGLLVFEDSDQFHQFVYELVQIHSQWTTQCAFILDPNCVCRQTSKS
jgi:hypothetical protein